MNAYEMLNKMYKIYDEIQKASEEGKEKVEITGSTLSRNPKDSFMTEEQRQILINKGYTVSLSTNKRNLSDIYPIYLISWKNPNPNIVDGENASS